MISTHNSLGDKISCERSTTKIFLKEGFQLVETYELKMVALQFVVLRDIRQVFFVNSFERSQWQIYKKTKLTRANGHKKVRKRF